MVFSRHTLRRRFRTACRVLGPERPKTLTIHHGRHTFISHPHYSSSKQIDTSFRGQTSCSQSRNVTQRSARLVVCEQGPDDYTDREQQQQAVCNVLIVWLRQAVAQTKTEPQPA